ncbi:Flp family type IVb pilin [Rhodovibrionaceae bacterium A322]
MKSLIQKFIREESGVSAIEYALLGAAVVAGMAVVLGSTGESGTGLMAAIEERFQAITDGVGTGG